MRWLRRVVWAIGGVLLLWGLAYVAVPLVLKSQLQKIATEKLGRTVTVGTVDFKPWSLELTLNDLAIARSGAGSPQTSPQLSIKRIYIDAELESLLRLAPVADAIEVSEPVASLTHLGAGRYDIDDVLDRLQTPAGQPASAPLQFALYNLVLKGGALDFNDLSVQKTHQLRDLDLAVPFLSNLKSKREIKTSPRLAFRLNGSVFDSAAEATPFAQTRKTDATLKLSGVDLKPYLGYLPASLPFRLQEALLDADLKVDFAQTPATVVKIAGTVTATRVQLLEAAPAQRPTQAANAGKPPAAAGPALLAFDRLQIVMDEVRPLEQFVKLSSVELTGPRLRVERDRAGRLNLLPPPAAVATKNIADNASKSRAAGQKGFKDAVPVAPPVPAAAAQPVQPWKVIIARLAVRDGKVNWLDETLASPAQIALVGLNMDAQGLALPFVASAPLQFKGSLGLDPAFITSAAPIKPTASPDTTRRSKARPAAPAATAAAAPIATPQAASAAQLSFSGTATDQAATVTADLAGWPLSLASRYVGQFLLPALGGQLDAQLGVSWQAAAGDKPQALQVTAPQLALRDVQLAQGKTSLVSVKRLQIEGAELDMPGQSFKAKRLTLTEPKALVARDASKRWMFERWRVERSAPQAVATATDAGATAKPAAPSWAVAINEVLVEGGALSFSDKAAGKPVAFDVSALNAQLQGLVLDDRQTGTSAARAARTMPLTASLRLASGRFEPGKLDFKGSLGLAPVQAQGQLAISRLPVQAFEPYFAEAVNIDLLRADASFKGRVAYRQTAAGPVAQLTGDAALEDMKANTLAPSEDLLAWKALNLRGLSVALDPAKATRVDVKETVLTDFFARVIVTPEGRINLQDLLKKPGASAAAAAPAASNAPPDAINTVAARADSVRAGAAKDAKDSAEPAPIVNVGPLSLINGKVLFSDRFIKPNYSADLTELTGKLGAFSSEAPTAAAPSASPGSPPAPQVNMADLELRGRAEGTASLEITGKLNPLAKPLALDITGKVRDLELPPLSPYAIKYAGYGITRGKMSVDVNYVVLPNGQLTAKNKLVLNQLSFGDKVEGAPASLPVKLAAALLADLNGVIDLDLPISGSLNDPQFSLGPVIIKVILNVIAKAITAPFSLLAGVLGGGGEELGSVSFAHGSAQLAPEAKAGLDKVAKALTDRPALRLTVVGTSSVEAEREGFKRERLDEMVKLVLAEKRRTSVKDGGSAPAVLSVSPAQYPALLREVYKRADMPKPRNVVGLAKDLPVDEMEKLLLANIKVSDDDLRELAVQRGVAVKDYLAAASLPPERLFLGAAKTVPPGAKWTPRAELNLAMP